MEADVDLQLRDDVAVVVGGAKGIGYGIARGFALEKSRVALLDIDPGVGDVAAQLSEECGVEALGVSVDCADYQAVCAGAEAVMARFGRCDHVVFAAGKGSGKYGFPFWNMEPADWKSVIDVNLMGATHVAHAFGKLLVEARRGTILFLASVAGQTGSQTDPPYSAAKAGVINFAQCAAKDLAAYDVRVNTICPGMVQTELVHSIWEASQEGVDDDQRLSFEEWSAEKIERLAPLGRWQSVEDIAALAVFLASPLGRNITGQTMNVDGGQVMRG